MGCVYEFVFPHGKRYVGMTTQKLSKRMSEHRGDSKDPLKIKLLYKATNKHGWENIKTNILYEDQDNDKEMLFLIEAEFIAKYRSEGIELYNMTDGGAGGVRRILTEQAKNNLRAAWTDKRRVDQAEASRRNWNDGRRKKFREFMAKRHAERKALGLKRKPVKSQIDDASLDKIIELANGGMKAREISKIVGFNRASIQSILSRSMLVDRIGDRLNYITDKNHITSPKLSEDDVHQLRRKFMQGAKISEMRKEYPNVTNTALKDLRRGKTWGHLKTEGWEPIKFNIKEPLTEDQVREIKQRLAKGEKQVDIAKDYGVNSAFISMINTGKRCKNVK